MNSLSNVKRIVIKVGTSTLTHSTGMLNLRQIEALVKIIADVKNSGKEVVLVSSGAVGIGAGKLGLSGRPDNTTLKQACAAVGQSELIQVYDRSFSEYNHIVAQVLLTRDVIDDKTTKENAHNAFIELIKMNVLPIVNENDTISIEEIKAIENAKVGFGDNDRLSAIVASLIDADLLIILTDTDGLFDKDPRQNSDATLIDTVHNIEDAISCVSEGNGSTFSTGGMATKLEAAKIATSNDIKTVIMNGNNPKKMYELLEGKKVGTRFLTKGE